LAASACSSCCSLQSFVVELVLVVFTLNSQ